MSRRHAKYQQQQQQEQQVQASVMHEELDSQSELPAANSARVGICSDSQPDPNTQTGGNMDHSRPLNSTGQASGSQRQPREEHASSSKVDEGSRQPNGNHWKGRTRGTARKDSCSDEQPSAKCLQVASEAAVALDSEPLPSHKTAKGKGKPKHGTQGKKRGRGEGSGAGESGKHDKELSPQAHAHSKRRKTSRQRKQQVAELDSLADEPVKNGSEHDDQAGVGQHHPHQGSTQLAPVAGLQSLCKLRPSSSDAEPLGKEPDSGHICKSLHQYVIIATRRGVAGDDFVSEHTVIALAITKWGRQLCSLL